VCFAWQDGDSTSAGTEWFVALSDVPALRTLATPIGEVIAGMDVVDRIAQVSTRRDRHPLRDVRIASARLEPRTAPDSTKAAPAAAEAVAK
jgi:cyclophilin family peptidyl-prolyl cis-trans isomerase